MLILRRAAWRWKMSDMTVTNVTTRDTLTYELANALDLEAMPSQM